MNFWRKGSEVKGTLKPKWHELSQCLSIHYSTILAQWCENHVLHRVMLWKRRPFFPAAFHPSKPKELQMNNYEIKQTQPIWRMKRWQAHEQAHEKQKKSPREENKQLICIFLFLQVHFVSILISFSHLFSCSNCSDCSNVPPRRSSASKRPTAPRNPTVALDAQKNTTCQWRAKRAKRPRPRLPRHHSGPPEIQKMPWEWSECNVMIKFNTIFTKLWITSDSYAQNCLEERFDGRIVSSFESDMFLSPFLSVSDSVDLSSLALSSGSFGISTISWRTSWRSGS